MVEQGSPSPPFGSNGENCEASIDSQPLDATKRTTDAGTTSSASRRPNYSGGELPASTQLPTTSLHLDINNLTSQFLGGLSLGGTSLGTRSPATPRIDAALSRMVGLQALPEAPLQPNLPHTAPTSPVTLPPVVTLPGGSSSSLVDVPSPQLYPSTAPASLLPSPNQPPAMPMLPLLPVGVKGALMMKVRR